MHAHLEALHSAPEFHIRGVVSLSNARFDDGSFVLVQVLVQRVLRAQVRKPKHHFVARVKRHRSEFYRVARRFSGGFRPIAFRRRLRAFRLVVVLRVVVARAFRFVIRRPLPGIRRRVRRFFRHRFGIHRRFGDRRLFL
jgi:hypothetical protein